VRPGSRPALGGAVWRGGGGGGRVGGGHGSNLRGEGPWHLRAGALESCAAQQAAPAAEAPADPSAPQAALGAGAPRATTSRPDLGASPQAAAAGPPRGDRKAGDQRRGGRAHLNSVTSAGPSLCVCLKCTSALATCSSAACSRAASGRASASSAQWRSSLSACSAPLVNTASGRCSRMT
jgi:hypothetical protein